MRSLLFAVLTTGLILVSCGEGERGSDPWDKELPSADESDGNAPGIPELEGPVHTTDSGLRYIVAQEGDGDLPGTRDWVIVHYTGWLTDGTKFDSSVDRGEPTTFPLYGVIQGWTEGLQLMNVGAKYRFIIPPDLAYGPRGGGERIPPDATLIFDIELLSFTDQKTNGGTHG